MRKFFSVIDLHSRIYGLDLFRALAILMVLIGHTRIILLPIDQRFEYLSLGGLFGVESFFVLSGFLIGGIIIKTLDNSRSFNFRSVKNFWIRRWFRTLPNYYLALFLNVVVLLLLKGQLFKPFRHLLFIQGFTENHPYFFNEAWSLAIEEWFYLILPILVLGFSTIKYFKKGKSVLLALCTIILGCLLLRIANTIGSSPSWDAGVRKITFLRLDSIAFGCLFAYYFYYYSSSFFKWRYLYFIIGILLIAFNIYWYFSHKSVDLEDSFSKTLFFSSVNFSFACLLPAFYTMHSPAKPSIFRKAIIHTSLISYSLYLYHFGTILLVINELLDFRLVWKPLLPLIYIVYWFFTYVVCTLIYKYYEKPMTLTREKFTKRDSFKKV